MNDTSFAFRLFLGPFLVALFLFLGLVVALTACSPKPIPAPAPAVTISEGQVAQRAEREAQPPSQPFEALVTSPRIPVVYFAFDSDRLTPDAAREIDRVLDGRAEAWTCQVVGHASQEGSRDYNLDLGRRRAEAVAEYIGARANISTLFLSEGEASPVATQRSEYWRNRRAEVSCQ